MIVHSHLVYKLIHIVLITYICGFYWACVEVDLPASSTLDASMSIVGDNPVEPVVATESKNLYFNTRAGAFVFNFSTQKETLICEASSAKYSQDGQRILCIPDSISSNLILSDPLTGPLIEIESWEFSSFASPQIAQSGKFFATLIPQENDLNHIAVYNEFGDEIQKIKALILHGFAGDKHLVINDPPEFWSFDDPFVDLIPITDRKMMIHPFEPYGTVIEDDKKIYFLGVEASASTLLTEGSLVNIKNQRLLIKDRTSDGKIELKLFDLLDNRVISTYEYPSIPFNRELYLELVNQNSILLAEQNTRRCGSERVSYNLKSVLINMESKKATTLIDEDIPHQVVAHHKSSYAVVSELDNCARPTGYSFLVKTKNQKKVDLPAEIKEKVREAALSALGEFIILRGEDSLWIMDTSSLSHRLIHGNEPILPGLNLN